MSAALAAAEEGAHVAVMSKGSLDHTNTRYAQGGIAAAVGKSDRPEFHAGDTMILGRGLCNPEIVDALTARAPAAIDWLVKAGMQFDRNLDGTFDLGREGGHREARVLHSHGTATGLELQRVLIQSARGQRNLDLHPHGTAIDLLKDAEGRVAGVLALQGQPHSRTAEPVFFEASEVILATGGGGQIYRETTNPQLATGDGLAMAARAGACLQDLEFVQFHPTILYLAGAARFLISEVTRGAGAVLRDRSGVAFMDAYHSDRELAPRDVVSRAIFDRMIQTGDTHVYLDLSDVPDPGSKFPALARITGEFGIDIRKHPIPVRPAVHYFVGGVAADLHGRTSKEGLWATGEVASTGFHGANRMGSNSLLEGLVHGRLVGQTAAQQLNNTGRRFLLPGTNTATVTQAELNLNDMVYSLKSLMWRQVGIVREGLGLQDAAERMSAWEGYLARLGPATPVGVEAVNMVQVAQLLTFSALYREESRGTHCRSDFSETRDEWNCHTRIEVNDNGLQLFQSSSVGAEAKADRE